MKGRGCETCNNTGYKGRIALYEVMPFTDPLKELVLQGASAAEIKAEMIRGGMQSLRMAGITEDPRGRDDARGGPAHHGRRLRIEHGTSSTSSSCSRRWSTRGRRTSTSPPARRRSCASTASWCRCRPTPLTPGRHQAALLLGPDRRAEAALRGGPRARLLVRRQGPGALPRQRLHAARRGRRRVPPRPVQDHARSTSSACRRSSPSCARSRAAWCWSPGRPARASRPRWRR